MRDEIVFLSDHRLKKPALAAIIVFPDKYNAVRRTMSYLQAQTAAKQMEVILVVSSLEQCGFDKTELDCFHSWQVVESGTIKSIAHGFATGTRKAQAPVVVFTEDHSFPEANWAQMLITAHKQQWAAVGPKIKNGNPESMVSWGDFYASYSEWAHPVSPGTVRHLPGHNSSYKRDVLLTFGEKLDSLMQAESVLHRYLKARGYKLWLESNTYTSHLNFTAWTPWIKAQYYTGRQFASTWAQPWSWARRLLFTIGSPGIPWLRFWRIQKYVRMAHTSSFFIRLLPILLAGLLANGLGQMVGYAAGASDSVEKVTEHERHRFKDT
ncbi:hypothetical protein ACFLTP_01150 [Chloroflexota bacterium]